ncbi:MAG: hypothetical protein AAFV88_15950 [Planctomycetota bacterium]
MRKQSGLGRAGSRPDSNDLNVLATSVSDDLALVRSVRLVQAFVLVGLLWKIKLFGHVSEVYFAFPQTDTFFPAPLQSLVVLRLAYCVAVLSSIVAVRLRGAGPLRIALLALVAALSTLLIHQGSYNDATFLTSWWASVWCLWVSGQLGRADPNFTMTRSKRLACVVLSIVMLGPAIGKWTAEYWSGEVFYEIYYRSRDFWLYNWLRDTADPAGLRRLAMMHARMAILVETMAGLTLWILPHRLAGWLALAIMVVIPLTNNWLLFSVTLSLIGLSLVLVRKSPFQ